MALIHHNGLRVNAPAPDDADQMAVFHDSGWRAGPHKDSDPDDPSPVPRVLEAVDEDETDATNDTKTTAKTTNDTKTAAKATNKKDS